MADPCKFIRRYQPPNLRPWKSSYSVANNSADAARLEASYHNFAPSDISYMFLILSGVSNDDIKVRIKNIPLAFWQTRKFGGPFRSWIRAVCTELKGRSHYKRTGSVLVDDVPVTTPWVKTCCYTTLWNINVRKWHHPEIRIAINDDSQGSIANNFRCDLLLHYTFTIHSAVSCAPFALHFCPQRCRSRR